MKTEAAERAGAERSGQEMVLSGSGKPLLRKGRFDVGRSWLLSHLAFQDSRVSVAVLERRGNDDRCDREGRRRCGSQSC
jgi:hypothetical protein